MRRNLIIMANSRKMGNRCIAGIDADSGEWVRPVYGAGDQGVPWDVRQVQGAEPRLLDIVSIPLASDGPHRDIQPENCRILEGPWKRIGEATVQQVAKYCQRGGLILHNTERWIHIDQLCQVAAKDRRSLCLIRASVAFSTGPSPRGGERVWASFRHGGNQYRITVTDYEFEHAFPAHGTREVKCLLTVSLGTPYERDNCCYKFVAGVIEL